MHSVTIMLRRRRQCGQHNRHAFAEAREHGSIIRKYNHREQVIADDDNTQHDRLECGVMYPAGHLFNQARLEKDNAIAVE